MRKNIFLITTITIFSVLLLSAFASAYQLGYYPSSYSGYDDGYERTSYVKTTVKDSPYGPSYSKTTTYNKETDKIYLGARGYQKVTSYTKTETRSPDNYHSNYYSPRSNRYYGSYYPKSSYTYNSQPYYKHNSVWQYKPSYTYSRYGSGDKYGYDYYYSPQYVNGHYSWRY